MKKRRFVLGLTIVLMVGCAITVWFAYPIWQTQRPDVPLKKLLVEELEPISLYPGCDTTERQTVNWASKGDNYDPQIKNDLFGLRKKPQLAKTWRVENTYVSLNVSVVEYGTPFEGNWAFNNWKPEYLYPYHENFVGEIPDSMLYPSGWQYDSRYADEEHVICGAGSPDCCWTWFYSARFGQYLLLVEFLSLDRLAERGGMGMDAITFEEIVTKIDAHVSEKLSD